MTLSDVGGVRSAFPPAKLPELVSRSERAPADGSDPRITTGDITPLLDRTRPDAYVPKLIAHRCGWPSDPSKPLISGYGHISVAGMAKNPGQRSIYAGRYTFGRPAPHPHLE